MLFGHDTMSRLPDPLLIGDWLADPRDDSLTRGSERVKVEPRTMRLLMRMALTPGVVVSQEELLESVWTGVVVSPASVYQSMSQLRKVLGDTDDPPRYIETVARKGYRLIATVAAPDNAKLPAPEYQIGASVPGFALAFVLTAVFQILSSPRATVTAAPPTSTRSTSSAEPSTRA